MNFKDCDIIIFTLSRWDEPFSSPAFCLAKEFSLNQRIFYIDHPFTYKDLIKENKNPQVTSRKQTWFKGENRYRKIDGFDNITAIVPNLTLPMNWLKNGKLYRQLWAYNNKIMLQTVQQAIVDLGIKNYIYINSFNPYFMPVLPKEMKPAPVLNVYQCIDDMTQDIYTAKHGARLENEAVRQADLCIATSGELTRLKSAYSSNVFLLPNAVDLAIFESTMTENFERPEELKGLEDKTIIGYTGNINEVRIDYPLLKKIAQTHSDKILLMVGPLNSNDYKEYGLDKMPNIVFTGGKPITELPKYLQYMDCTIIPFLCNKLTKSIYPLKINEYLAAGKAIIATSFSDDIRSFGNVAYIAGNHKEFIQNIDRAIAENTTRKQIERLEVAKTNTWTARVKRFWEIIDEFETQKIRAILFQIKNKQSIYKIIHL